MHGIISFNLIEIEPSKDAVLKENSYPLNKVPANVLNLVEEAAILFRESAVPVGICTEISKDDFSRVLYGNGNNEIENPLQDIYLEAENLSLFALTLGNKISDKIQDLFNKNDFAMGHMLDCIASLTADSAVRKLEAMQRNDLFSLAYSPGYCGWHISGQQKIFEYLHPKKIGITLNKSFLMTPIKSVSGVIVSGSAGIHQYRNEFEFCNICSTKTCLDRMKKLIDQEK